MFCNKCGNQIPDGVNFCTNCGAPIEASAAPQPTEPTPNLDAVMQPDFNNSFVSKSQYLKTYASKKVKSINLAYLITSIVCIAMLVFNLLYASLISFVDIPIVQLVVSNSDEISEDEFYDAIDEIKYSLDEDISEREKREFEDEFGLDADDFIDDCKKLADNPSIFNFTTVITKYEDFLEQEADLDDEAFDILSGAFYFYIGLFAIGFIFAIFGLIFKKQGLIITGNVFAVIFALPFAGVVFAVLSFGLLLAASILLSNINKGYINFKNGYVG